MLEASVMFLARSACVLVVASACTFPEITIVVEDGGGGQGGASTVTTTITSGATSTQATSTTTTTTSTSGGGGAGGTGGGCPDVDGDDETSVVCGGLDCDDDDDGAPIDFGECCPAEPCDCNDADDRVRPGQAAFFTQPWDGDDDYDYDCSSFEEPRYTTTCPQEGVLSCGDGKAFVTSTPCGQTGQAQGCTGILGSCSKSGAAFSLQQECH